MTEPAATTPDKRILSATQVGTFLRCPRQWFYRYGEGIKTPPSGALSLGRAAHEALKHNYRQKVETRADLPADEVVEFFRDDLHAREDETALSPEEDFGKITDAGIRCVGKYQKVIAPRVQPSLVEEKFEVVFENRNDLGLRGRIDLVDEGEVVHDAKFSGKKPAITLADRSMQLTLYGVGYQELRGQPPRGYQLDVVTKTRDPGLYCLQTTRSATDFQRALQLLAMVDATIKTGLFPPADPEHWVCSEKWCGYWNRCPFGATGRKII